MSNFPNAKLPFETLCEEDELRIIYCYKCQAFHVSYGAIYLDLYKPAMEQLIHALEEKKAHYERLSNGYMQSIQVKTNCKGVSLLMNLFEVNYLLKMLRKAFWKFEANYWGVSLN
ncbi:MAG: DUF6686 family protein [Bacteroidota bacterium]